MLPSNSNIRYIHKIIKNICSEAVEATYCLSFDEWISKMWYIYIMEYYLLIERNERNIDICYKLDEPHRHDK